MSTIYTGLLSIVRARESKVGERSVILQAESDRGRLLFCPAFRRLQQKAQVFSLESNAAVRSRLTHSLEVAQMGRYIADKISIELVERNLATAVECTALTTFVETACLMHDIGNPPFGHFGESAIAQWFREFGRTALIKSCQDAEVGSQDICELEVEKALNDFFEFDGNPQGIRVVTKLQRNSDEFGLNLTVTTIAAYLKYVRGSMPSDESLNFMRKRGYFSTEERIISNIWKELGYLKPQRYPLAYIMEAADDIAYCISDLEDSIEKGLLHKGTALTEIYTEWSKRGPYSDNVADQIDDVLKKAVSGRDDDDRDFTYTDFRTSLNRILATFSAEQYIVAHKDVLEGKCKSLIPAESSAGSILETLKNYCKKKVYRHETVQVVELAGYRAIYGLLEQFKCLLEASESRFLNALNYDFEDGLGRPIIVENKLLSIFPKNYKAVYLEHKEGLCPSRADYRYLEWNLRAHLITDFIAGMTDDFAIKTYQVLNGIKL